MKIKLTPARLLFFVLLPMTVSAVVTSLVLSVSIGFKNPSASEIVTIDPVKITNAQRAAASKLLEKDLNAESTMELVDVFHLSKRVDEIVKEEAKGKIVLVKQAVLSEGLTDITDTVLKKANLPVDAPTIDIGKQLNMAPTNHLGNPLMEQGSDEK